jgi:hypothetical protein
MQPLNHIMYMELCRSCVDYTIDYWLSDPFFSAKMRISRSSLRKYKYGKCEYQNRRECSKGPTSTAGFLFWRNEPILSKATYARRSFRRRMFVRAAIALRVGLRHVYPAATPRRMISIASVFARSKALSSSGRPLLRVAISCAALAYCCVVAQIM